MNATQILTHLIQKPSISPVDSGCMEFITEYLHPYDFKAFRLNQNGTSNLFLKLERGPKHICFAGHTDVVPVLEESLWRYLPFAAAMENEILFGRGAVDMKGAIAAFLSVIPEIIAKTNLSLSLLLTSDEEGPATYGTRLLVDYLKKNKESIDLCIVGEPTSEDYVGDTIKWGRRGSLSAHVHFRGQSGHVAYPQKAKNPIPAMLEFLNTIAFHKFDAGVDGFDTSNLEITSIDTGNDASNVIPGHIQAKFNIRFNPTHSVDSLKKWLEMQLQRISKDAVLIFSSVAEPFYGCSRDMAENVAKVLSNHAGKKVNISTSGGTSDARFIKDMCPVIELGLKNETAHKVDEHVSLDDLATLSRCYVRLFCAFQNGFEK